MDKQIHLNFIKASNIIFGTVGLGIISYYLSGVQINIVKNNTHEIFTLIIISGIAILVRQGKGWIKYLLLIMTLLGGLIGIPIMINDFTPRPIPILINIVESGMQIWATILLFKVPKNTEVKMHGESRSPLFP